MQQRDWRQGARTEGRQRKRRPSPVRGQATQAPAKPCARGGRASADQALQNQKKKRESPFPPATVQILSRRQAFAKRTLEQSEMEVYAISSGPHDLFPVPAWDFYAISCGLQDPSRRLPGKSPAPAWRTQARQPSTFRAVLRPFPLGSLPRRTQALQPLRYFVWSLGPFPISAGKFSNST